MRFPLSLVATAVLLLVGGSAFAQVPWSDNFDGYPPNTSLHGVGGWKGWDNNPAATAFVRGAPAPSRSAPQSVEIALSSDLVHTYSGVNSGQVVYSAWNYIPTAAGGVTYFILLNTYNDSGPYNWSTQLELDMDANVARDYYSTATKPLVRGRWVEIRVEIDFAADQQQLFYDGGTPLSTSSWRRTGVANLAAVDLFGGAGASGRDIVYYDDIDLRRPGATAVESTSWGQIKANFR